MTKPTLDFCEEGNNSGYEFKKPSKLKRINRFSIGKPVMSLEELRTQVGNVDKCGFVKKKVIEEGAGKKIHEESTVSLALTGFWEKEDKPFHFQTIRNPMIVDLRENGLLPGLQIAIKSMAVGELSMFLLSHEVMYGAMDVPPRIKPNADCVYYIKVITSVITPEDSLIMKTVEKTQRPAAFNLLQLLDSEARSPYSRNNRSRRRSDELQWRPSQDFAAELLDPIYNPAPVEEPPGPPRLNVHYDADEPFDHMVDMLCSVM